MSRLVLGTAQWGNPYGITNSRGRLSDSEISGIVQVARERSIIEIDTARGYGDSEIRLRPFATDFAITTKISGQADAGSQIEQSLADLGVSQINAVLVHDWDSLEEIRRIDVVRGLGEALSSGLVLRVGVSVYDQVGIESAEAVFDSLDVRLGSLQVPANPLDRRLDESTSLMRLHGAGAHITVRSAFLQGVLLADNSRWSNHADVASFQEHVREHQTSALATCLGHARALPWATNVVVGVTSAQELSAVCDAWDSCAVGLLSESLSSSDLELIDPRRW